MEQAIVNIKYFLKHIEKRKCENYLYFLQHRPLPWTSYYQTKSRDYPLCVGGIKYSIYLFLTSIIKL